MRSTAASSRSTSGDPHAVGGEVEADRLAEPAGATGDDRDRSLEPGALAPPAVTVGHVEYILTALSVTGRFGGGCVDLLISNKSFLVVGGTAGMGLAGAKAIAAEGARVVVAGRDADRAASAAAEVAAAGAAAGPRRERRRQRLGRRGRSGRPCGRVVRRARRRRRDDRADRPRADRHTGRSVGRGVPRWCARHHPCRRSGACRT